MFLIICLAVVFVISIASIIIYLAVSGSDSTPVKVEPVEPMELIKPVEGVVPEE